MDNNKLKEYEELLKTFDWYFSSSDSPKVFAEGLAEHEKIVKLRGELGDIAVEMYNRYSPFKNTIN